MSERGRDTERERERERERESEREREMEKERERERACLRMFVYFAWPIRFLKPRSYVRPVKFNL